MHQKHFACVEAYSDCIYRPNILHNLLLCIMVEMILAYKLLPDSCVGSAVVGCVPFGCSNVLGAVVLVTFSENIVDACSVVRGTVVASVGVASAIEIMKSIE